jgi:hypothetical protein
LASFGESDSMPNWRLASFGAGASAAILAAGFVRRGPRGRFGAGLRCPVSSHIAQHTHFWLRSAQP